MRIYTGRRDKLGNTFVRVIGDDGETHELPMRLELANHSPTGFEWGYGGSGPAQLALAILADALQIKEATPHLRWDLEQLAVRLHQEFKWQVITPLKRDESWRITQSQVLEFIATARRKIEP